MTHPLHKLLFGEFTPPPITGTITHRIMKDMNPNRYKAPLATAAIRMKEALTGFKWWTAMELSDYLEINHTLIYNYLSRHSKKFGIESFVSPDKGYKFKYYRIQP